jgi:hypothetical protein
MDVSAAKRRRKPMMREKYPFRLVVEVKMPKMEKMART